MFTTGNVNILVFIRMFGWFLLSFILANCSKEPVLDPLKTGKIIQKITLSHPEILEKFQTEFIQMAEKEIAISADSSTYAQYALPTDRYKHGALGDYWEAGQLVVYNAGVMYQLTLSEMYVFEDIRPRLFDVDNDSIPEIIAIRSRLGEGAGIVVYKLWEDGIKEYAYVDEIGISNRWLNIAAIYDMDEDGITEIVWVQTPHIGGILKGAEITAGEMVPSDQIEYYSNHQGGLLNLCLSVVTFEEDLNLCYVPNQNRNAIAGFSFLNGKFQLQQEITQTVDFSTPLITQYPFCNVVSGNLNCIAPSYD